MVNDRIKRLGEQGIGFRKVDAGRDLLRQLFGEVAMQRIFRPQHFTARRSGGGQLNQCVLLVIRHAQHALARHQRPGVALAGWTWQQTLRTRLRQLTILLRDSTQLRAFLCPRDERVQRLCQYGFQLRIHRTFRILTCQRHAQRILRTVRQQTVQIERTARFRAGAGQTFAAKRLYAYHGTDHVAVHVQVAHSGTAGDLGNGFVDAGMHAERQAIAGSVDLLN